MLAGFQWSIVNLLVLEADVVVVHDGNPLVEFEGIVEVGVFLLLLMLGSADLLENLVVLQEIVV